MVTRSVALPTVLAAAAVLATSAVMAATPSDALAATTCTYTPRLPDRVVVNRPTLNFHTPVTITGAGCARNFSASESLVHRTDKYFLNWTYNSRTASDAVYATTVVPGTYTTAHDGACTAYGTDGSSLPCTVGAGSTVIKFAGSTSLAAARGSGAKAAKVTFTVKASRYAGNASHRASLSVRVAVQQYVAGAWKTIHSGTTAGAHGYTWTHTARHAARYRAVSAASTSSFADVSRTVTR